MERLNLLYASFEAIENFGEVTKGYKKWDNSWKSDQIIYEKNE